MRLHKCKKVTSYLIKENMIDERQIWCYAQMKAKIKIQTEPVTMYAMVLVSVNQDRLYIFNTEYNSTKFEQIYSCKINEMEEVRIKKKLLTTTLCFIRETESFQLELDYWKRFSDIFDV